MEISSAILTLIAVLRSYNCNKKVNYSSARCTQKERNITNV